MFKLSFVTFEGLQHVYRRAHFIKLFFYKRKFT